MGLFDTQKKVKVGTSVARVISDDLLPDSVKTGVITALFEDGDPVDYVMEELVGGIGVRAERMYEYAKDHYTYGLPSGSVHAATQGTEAVQTVLNTLAGGYVALEYSRFGPINAIHVGWMRLISDHGYDPATNELPPLSTVHGKPVYLKHMQVMISPAIQAQMSAAALEQWGPPTTAGFAPSRVAQIGTLGRLRTDPVVVVDPAVVEEHLLVTVEWEDPTFVANPLYPDAEGRFKTDTFTIPLSGFDPEADYFHAKYVFNEVTYYWLYEVGTGGYPTLDAVFDDPPSVSGTYFPFAYFRFGKQSMATLEGTPEYVTSKKLTKYLGIDYADMIEAIHENPDIADVEQAMLTFAVSPNTTDPLERRYLFDYFRQQHNLQNAAGTSAAIDRIRAKLDGFNGSRSSNLTVIQDTRFKMTLGNNGIYKKLVPGKLGDVGESFSTYRTLEETYRYIDASTGLEVSYPIVTPIHVFQRQVTASVYEEIEVHNMRMTYFISGRHTTTGDEADDILLVPLDRSITEDYPMPVREKLYARALHYVFNSKVTTKLAWYEQEWFRIVIAIAAVVITVISLGSAGPATAAYLSAIAAGTVTAMAVLIGVLMTYILPYLLIALTVKLFVEAVGPEAAMVAAVVAVVAAMFGVFDAGSLAGAPWAENLLQVTNMLTSQIGSVISDSMNDLLGEYTQFGLYVEEQNALLEKANDLLETKSWLSPFVVFGESPNDFYNRTTHSGNIGAVGISAIGSFVDVALTLPTLNQTLGAPFNVLQ